MTDTAKQAHVIARNAVVCQLIADAGIAQASVYELARSAARAAVEGFEPGDMTLAQQVESIAAAYAEDFAKVDHNVRAIFKDCATLLLAKDAPVSLEVKKDGKSADLHTTAKDAAAMPKHAMREAAKQVREQNGMARKTGGGRKPQTPTAAPEQIVPQDTEAAFAAWLTNLPVYLHGPDTGKRVVAKLKEMGYTLTLKK